MPDRRAHRGPHPEDAESFAPAAWERLQAAVADYSWLLTRSYAEPSAIKVVGDRYGLHQRQRMAVVRSACTDESLRVRREKLVSPESVAGRPIWVDGLNVLTTIEVALGGGVILLARDGCYRDIAGVHGTYRKVEETRPAIREVGILLEKLRVPEAVWLLDSPVGNSGRLAKILREMAAISCWNWEVRTVQNPDPELIATHQIGATADSVILDQCRQWFNLAREVIDVLQIQGVVPMCCQSV